MGALAYNGIHTDDASCLYAVAIIILILFTYMDQSQEFLKTLLQALVDNPDAVEVVRTVDEMGVLMTVTVSPEDMGKVIGRQGATAKSIRTLLRVVGMKDQQRVNMKIEKPEGGMRFGQDDDGQEESEPQAPKIQSADIDDVDAAIADLKNEF